MSGDTDTDRLKLLKVLEANTEVMASVKVGLADIAKALKAIAKPKKIKFDSAGRATEIE
jgi:hypothetical protein